MMYVRTGDFCRSPVSQRLLRYEDFFQSNSMSLKADIADLSDGLYFFTLFVLYGIDGNESEVKRSLSWFKPQVTFVADRY